MGKLYLEKYGVETTFNFDLFAIDGVDFKVDAVHAAGDTKIMKNEGTEVATTNGFTDEGTGYALILTATEMTAARIKIYIKDQGTKVWLDTGITIETYGHANAQHPYFGEGVWDRSLTGATHNIPTSSGRRLRSQGDVVSGSVDDASAGLSSFITDLTGGHDDHYADQTLLFTSGSLAGMSRLVLSYNSSTKLLVIEEDLPEAPADGEDFDINPVHIHPISQIVEEIVNEPAAGLAELLTAIKTRLASTIYVTEHPPVTTVVTNGTVLSGDNTSIQTLNQIYLKVQETGQWIIDTTYSGIDEVHERVYLTYRYFGSGSANHNIELYIWNKILSQWDNVLATERDLPATNEDRSLVFDIPGTLTDYYDGSLPNLSAKLRIEHVSNNNPDHQFWIDTIGFGELETIYVAPDNVSIEEIREWTEAFEAVSVLPYPGEFNNPFAVKSRIVEYPKNTDNSFPYDLNSDITGYTVKFMLKKNLSDSDASAIIALKDTTANVTTPADGLGLVPLTMAESNIEPLDYYAEVQTLSGATVKQRWFFKLRIVENIIDGA